jgi:hypothetical protein
VCLCVRGDELRKEVHGVVLPSTSVAWRVWEPWEEGMMQAGPATRTYHMGHRKVKIAAQVDVGVEELLALNQAAMTCRQVADCEL